ncbi:hypothetical protein Taro_018157 [Colocasia esculenta]|uniref:Uncharacterized protein n=1 Tax=Colocasia esculenta TaxID=4460 RepID=A0A843UT34_COLES|nr:hypothetical protein [Colocasia esculenta]
MILFSRFHLLSLVNFVGVHSAPALHIMILFSLFHFLSVVHFVGIPIFFIRTMELGGISIAMDGEKVSAQELMTSVKNMMRNTEFAVRSFMILHPRFLHTRTAITSNGTVGSQTGGATSTSNPPIQPAASSTQPFDFYSGVPKRPSPFFTNTVAEFEKYLAECRRWIEELEQLLHVDTKNTFPTMGTSLESLPSVLSNVYDYFIYVAAKVENLHQYIESMKTAYLADQRQRGDMNDPFLEADRREAAKLKAAARRIHPTLHLPAICSRPSQDAGLHVSSAMPIAPTVAHQPLGSSGASSGSGFLSLSVPSAATAASTPSSFLLSTPSSSAPTSTLFGSAGFSPQSTALGSAQTPLFGASTPAFTSTPAVGSSSLFSTPSFGPEIIEAEVSCPDSALIARNDMSHMTHSSAMSPVGS